MQEFDLSTNDVAKLKQYIQAQQVFINSYQSDLIKYQTKNQKLEAEIFRLNEIVQLLRLKHFGNQSLS